ncbi:agmatine deiminase family protein [Sciscionella sediminilitoris]|uniref:agmatine deiminase family protein n=1 Tax=Sciscionella sediminilitoris TaxID=1445613 RepID=UPI0018D1E1CD|nr:agmatine deiminase family protein [Sciscionella sp. SE31]
MTTAAVTPAAEGFAMPAEWNPHDACLMMWPCRSELWDTWLDAAKEDYATTARAIAAFEPVFMVCNPGQASEVRRYCGAGTEPLELPIDDSWARDCGPIFLAHTETAAPAVVNFRFNAWGNRWHPYDSDDLLPARVAEHFGVRRFDAPLVLEGGAFLVDGTGTVFTTEQCLLNPNRNPELSRAQIERSFRDHLGVRTVVWLPYGHSTDDGPAGTDGHIDGIAQVLAPGRVLLELPSDPASPEYERSRENLKALRAATTADGAPIEVVALDVPAEAEAAYANHYLANGAAIVPVTGQRHDAEVLTALAGLYPDREVVPVPGKTLAFGGGGPHCVTQQIPSGVL